jgi:hypothetical protein
MEKQTHLIILIPINNHVQFLNSKNKRKLRSKFVINFSSDGIILIGVKPANRRSAPLIHISIMHAKAKISL